jgi:HEPN domain-containing protein
MGLPAPTEARLYYRAAKQRYDDAELLLQSQRTTGAVYLAGYTIECMLKALLLANVARRVREKLLAEFRSSRAHNIEWLGGLLRRHTRIAIPRTITRHLARVASWSTDLRYAGRLIRRDEAENFMQAVAAVAKWADGSM